MLLPIPEDGSEGLNEGLNEGLKSVLQIIKDHPGVQARIISEQLNNRPIKTVERQIKTLTERELIERRGARRTGGYYLKGIQ
jgi:ATP-dependent DNA helicase RecG